MKYRLLGLAVGVAVGGGLLVGLEGLIAAPWPLAIAAALGTAAFLVVDGSAGTGEGWIYHRVRGPVERLTDMAVTAAGGLALGGIGASLSTLLSLGSIGGTALTLVGAMLGANAAFVYRRPDYEEQLEEME